MKTKKSILEGSQSNEQELLITVNYDLNASFNLKTKDNSNSIKSKAIYKERIAKKANVIVKAYSPVGSSTTLYKIDGIIIDP